MKKLLSQLGNRTQAVGSRLKLPKKKLDTSNQDIQENPSNEQESAQNQDSIKDASIEHRESKSRFQISSLFDKFWKKVALLIALILILLIAVLTTMGVYSLGVARSLMSKADRLQVLGKETYLEFKGQNLPAASTKLGELESEYQSFKTEYGKLGFYRSVPLARRYYLDGEAALTAVDHGLAAGKITLEAITPYADVLGFTGEGSFEGGTAEDRVKLILQTLEKVTPQLDAIESELIAMQDNLAEINPSHYPESLRDKAIRSNIVEVQTLAAGAVTALTDFRPIIEKMPEIAGAGGERKKYLVLFQNDNELRATGGFLTAYAVIFIEDGKVTPEKSDDIYELDKKFSKRIEIPEALGKYLTTERYWNLRDMNISPDFKISMEQFMEHYLDVPGEPENIDGVIAVDTELLTALLKVVGPIEIPGYGTFTAEIDERCDCPQIIYALSEIITKPTPYIREDRKGILGPLMRAILTKIYGSPRAYMADLFAIGLEAVEGRHLQAYLFEEEHQEAIEAINAGGRLIAPESKDFVAIIDSNLGGAKSNLFTSYEVEHITEAPVDGRLNKKITITYKNSREADNCNLEAGQLCLNSTLQDWFRLYVPSGAELRSAQGFTEEVKAYEESGLTVFDGFFKLEPKSQAKVTLEYSIPYSRDNYALEIWKQGGISAFPVLMDTNGGQEKIEVAGDTEYRAEF